MIYVGEIYTERYRPLRKQKIDWVTVITLGLFFMFIAGLLLGLK